MWNCWDDTTLAQNSDGSGTVGLGDIVGYAEGSRGDGTLNAIQATAANKLMYRAAPTGENGIYCPGSGDYLEATTGNVTQGTNDAVWLGARFTSEASFTAINEAFFAWTNESQTGLPGDLGLEDSESPRSFDRVAYAHSRPLPPPPSAGIAAKSASGSLPDRCDAGHSTENLATGKTHKILPANLERSYLIVQNNSALVMRLGVRSAARNGNGFKVAPGGYYEPRRVPTNEISVYFEGATGGTAEVTYVEGEG